jgi:hypothetical protein
MRETQLALSGLVPEQQAHKCWKALSMKKRWQWNSETALEDHVVAKAQTYSIGVKEDLLTSPQRDTATRISGVCAPGHNIFTRWCKLSICLAPSRLAGSVKMLKSISYDIHIYIYSIYSIYIYTYTVCIYIIYWIILIYHELMPDPVFILFYDSRNSDSRSGGQAGCEHPLPRGAVQIRGCSMVLPTRFNLQLSCVLICILCFCVIFFFFFLAFAFSLPFTPNLFSSQAERSLRLLLPLAVTEWRQR